MRSVVDSGVNPTLKNVKVPFRNIDDLILLDFVENENLKIAARDGGFYVEYPSGSMKLEDYHLLLGDLEESGATFGHLSSTYSIPEDLIKVISERPRTRFDVVFLDYVGTVYAKREKALEVLMNNRLKDRAVVAVTTNLNPAVNPKILSNRIPEHTLEQMIDASQGAECIIEDFEDTEYRDKRSSMYFVAYVIEKNGEKK